MEYICHMGKKNGTEEERRKETKNGVILEIYALEGKTKYKFSYEQERPGESIHYIRLMYKPEGH
jgi:hypothetical protein